MKIVNTVQNSREWLAWRGKGIGASDAAVITGDSEWCTQFELWTYITGLCTKPEPNPFAVEAMRRGQELEPKARVLAERDFKVAFTPLCLEDSTNPFIRASLDGFNGFIDYDAGVVREGGTILEIKCPGKKAHGIALKGKVPEYYYPQIQQQLMVSGAAKCIYYSWDGNADAGVPVEVLPDLAYMANLREKLVLFWSRVQMMMPPDCGKADLDKLVSRLTKDMERINMSVKALELLAGAMA